MNSRAVKPPPQTGVPPQASAAAFARRSHRLALRTHSRVNWYVIDQILGVGGFGITYLAHDSNLDQQVAIKEYLPVQLATRATDRSVQPLDDKKSEDYRWGLRRFISEAQTIAKFDHPNIVRVNSVFEANNTAYMVMRYEEGKNLNEITKNRRTLYEEQLLAIVIPVMNGLEIVHNTGFIHRDIKPSNIFIRSNGTPVLLDFGSARQALGHETHTLTSLVSPGYAPYEQYTSELTQQGPWTDIYGLGATLYRLITGVAPVDAVDRSKHQLRDGGDSLVPAIEAGEGRYSPRFLMAVDHALAFKEEERPRNIAEWRRDFGLSGDEEVPTIPGLLIEVDEATFDHEATTVSASMYNKPTVAVSPASRAGYAARTRRPWLVAAGLCAALAGAAFAMQEPLSRGFHHLLSSVGMAPDPDSVATAAATPAPDDESARRQATVGELILQAERHINPISLKEPDYKRAVERLREALTLDPGNPQAEAGIREIVAAHMDEVRTALHDRRFERAKARLNAALKALPGEPMLLEARRELDAREHAWRAEHEAEIDALMRSAAAHLGAGRWTQPAQGNAYQDYRDVLRLDPEHAGAQAGIEDIIQRYLKSGRSAVAGNDFSKAYELLKEANSKFYDEPRIQALRDQMEARRRIYKDSLRDGGQAAQGPLPPPPPEETTVVDHEPQYFRDRLADGGQGPLLATIPAGTFGMGDLQRIGDRDERPAIAVTLTRPFAMGVYELTFEDYDRFARATGRELPDDQGWGRGQRPVVGISWNDAKAYTEWLSDQTGSTYRLPSESEWEYAARGGTQTIYWWGDNPDPNLANCETCGGPWLGQKTAPVGSFPANPFGLHDVAGNVYEWTADCWTLNYVDAPLDGRPQLQGQCGNRVRRGGSYAYGIEDMRSSNRDYFHPIRTSNNTGFRVVRELTGNENLRTANLP